MTIIKVVIPAQNEEKAIGKVIAEIPDWVSEVIVADNGSTDATAQVAKKHGATVVPVPVPGYGRACLGGIGAAGEYDIIVFLDGDASDYPEDMDDLVRPIRDNEADMVIGSRPLCVNAATAFRECFGLLAYQTHLETWLYRSGAVSGYIPQRVRKAEYASADIWLDR